MVIHFERPIALTGNLKTVYVKAMIDKLATCFLIAATASSVFGQKVDENTKITEPQAVSGVSFHDVHALNVKQMGRGNAVFVNQSNSIDSSNVLRRTSVISNGDNRIEYSQSGSGQSDSRISTSVTQIGTGNTAVIGQSGSSNRISVSQSSGKVKK